MQKFIDILIGLQWGDEGKGKVLLKLIENYSAIVRFNGGHNAGHSLKVGDIELVAHILPSGGLIEGKELWLGGNVLVNHIQLLKEMVELKDVGFDVSNRIFIDHRAILASPFDCFIDSAEETFKSQNGLKVGTTGRGIGQGFGYDTTRNGLRYGNILKSDFKDRCKQHFDYQKNLLSKFYSIYGYEVANDILEKAESDWFEKLSLLNNSWISDLNKRTWDFAKDGKRILGEGAQAYMLDRVFGDYPNVTSSNTVPAALCLSLGLPHTVIGDVWGVAKPYVTKVGEGFFPSEMTTQEQEIWRKAGHEYGASTGRPRRIGWLDMKLLVDAILGTGTTKVFFAKADICPVDNIKIITEYTKDYFCLSEIKEEDLVIENMAGWPDFKENKENFNIFIKKVENILINKINNDVKIVGYGTGPEKDDIVFI